MSHPLVALLAILGAVALGAPAAADGHPRVVSLGPALTAILLELGAEELLVGVDDRSLRMLPAVEGQPRVGGLFHPSLEAIVALEPDLVVLVPGAEQRSLQERLEALDIEVLALPNTSLSELLACIETLVSLTAGASGLGDSLSKMSIGLLTTKYREMAAQSNTIMEAARTIVNDLGGKKLVSQEGSLKITDALGRLDVRCVAQIIKLKRFMIGFHIRP